MASSERSQQVSKPKEVTDAEFDTEVLKAELPVLVDFWAIWCGPCRLVAPLVDELAEEYADRMKFVKVNVDENTTTPATYGIQSIPTLLVFRDGKPVDQIIGFKPKSELRRLLEQAIARPSLV
jgi:thioredoxin 1